ASPAPAPDRPPAAPANRTTPAAATATPTAAEESAEGIVPASLPLSIASHVLIPEHVRDQLRRARRVRVLGLHHLHLGGHVRHRRVQAVYDLHHPFDVRLRVRVA